MSASVLRDRKIRLVIITYVLIAAVLTLSAALTAVISRNVIRNVDEIGANALESVRLLSRMALDLEQQQRLVEAHIFESTPRERAALDRRITLLTEDYQASARQYEPLATFQGEAQAWQRLQDDIDRVADPIKQVLALSRENRHEEAHAIMRRVRPAFDTIERDVVVSVEINAQRAQRSRSTARSLLATSVTYLLGFWLVGIAITVGAGIRTTRLLARAVRKERAAFTVLEERNRELDAFAGRVAHDLRSPMTLMSTAASMAEKQMPEGAKEATLIRRSVARMNAIIEDLLQLSRIEGAARSDVCDPAPAVMEVQETMAQRFIEAAASMTAAATPARVHCRDGLFRLIVSNLVENALKYRRADVPSQIRVSGRVIDGQYELRVSDNGIGMTAEEASHAFDPLFRARRLREVPGTGLGLSIVKRIAEACGGATSVESTLGQGTTIVIRLPLAEER